jgi:hypothetical protein
MYSNNTKNITKPTNAMKVCPKSRIDQLNAMEAVKIGSNFLRWAEDDEIFEKLLEINQLLEDRSSDYIAKEDRRWIESEWNEMEYYENLKKRQKLNEAEKAAGNLTLDD